MQLSWLGSAHIQRFCSVADARHFSSWYSFLVSWNETGALAQATATWSDLTQQPQGSMSMEGRDRELVYARGKGNNHFYFTRGCFYWVIKILFSGGVRCFEARLSPDPHDWADIYWWCQDLLPRRAGPGAAAAMNCWRFLFSGTELVPGFTVGLAVAIKWKNPNWSLSQEGIGDCGMVIVVMESRGGGIKKQCLVWASLRAGQCPQAARGRVELCEGSRCGGAGTSRVEQHLGSDKSQGTPEPVSLRAKWRQYQRASGHCSGWRTRRVPRPRAGLVRVLQCCPCSATGILGVLTGTIEAVTKFRSGSGMPPSASIWDLPQLYTPQKITTACSSCVFQLWFRQNKWEKLFLVSSNTSKLHCALICAPLDWQN